MCRKGDNEDLLLLCDGCDKGCHTYCHKPKITSIPEGDWYCPACISKVSEPFISHLSTVFVHMFHLIHAFLCNLVTDHTQHLPMMLFDSQNRYFYIKTVDRLYLHQHSLKIQLKIQFSCLKNYFLKYFGDFLCLYLKVDSIDVRGNKGRKRETSLAFKLGTWPSQYLVCILTMDTLCSKIHFP